jgi:hypothetical protein
VSGKQNEFYCHKNTWYVAHISSTYTHNLPPPPHTHTHTYALVITFTSCCLLHHSSTVHVTATSLNHFYVIAASLSQIHLFCHTAIQWQCLLLGTLFLSVLLCLMALCVCIYSCIYTYIYVLPVIIKQPYKHIYYMWWYSKTHFFMYRSAKNV